MKKHKLFFSLCLRCLRTVLHTFFGRPAFARFLIKHNKAYGRQNRSDHIQNQRLLIHFYILPWKFFQRKDFLCRGQSWKNDTFPTALFQSTVKSTHCRSECFRTGNAPMRPSPICSPAAAAAKTAAPLVCRFPQPPHRRQSAKPAVRHPSPPLDQAPVNRANPRYPSTQNIVKTPA